MSRAAPAFVAVVLVTVLASANAPPDQYVPFGSQQTFIIDQWTHLDWQRIVDPTPATQTDAVKQCAQIGHRLPTYRELLTIVDEDPHDEWDPDAGATVLVYVDPNAFPATPAGEFWTMSPSKNGVKVVDFKTGETRDESPTASAYVRCVLDVP